MMRLGAATRLRVGVQEGLDATGPTMALVTSTGVSVEARVVVALGGRPSPERAA